MAETYPTIQVSYTTVGLLKDQVPRVAKLTSVESDSLARSLSLAQAEINGKIAGKVQLPLTVDVPFLTTLATNLGAYYVLRRHFSTDKTNKSDWVMQFRDDAYKMIDQIVNGEVDLVDVDGQPVPVSSNHKPWSSTTDYKPTFADGLDVHDSRVDPDKVQDDLQDRGLD